MSALTLANPTVVAVVLVAAAPQIQVILQNKHND
jgi:hypothetical protein